jgi:hypothetical protein
MIKKKETLHDKEEGTLPVSFAAIPKKCQKGSDLKVSGYVSPKRIVVKTLHSTRREPIGRPAKKCDDRAAAFYRWDPQIVAPPRDRLLASSPIVPSTKHQCIRRKIDLEKGVCSRCA